MFTFVNCLQKIEQCVLYFNINTKPPPTSEKTGSSAHSLMRDANILLNYEILMNQVNKLNIKITNPHLTGCIYKPVY